MLMMKPPQTPTTSQLSEAEAAALQHDSYVVQRHMHFCTRCNSSESFTTLWEVWCHPAKTNKLGLVQRRATSEIKPDYPFRVVQMPAKDIPVCFNCAGSYRAEEADPTTPLSVAAWQETLRRKYAPAPAPEEKKSSKITPTLDML